MKTYIVFRLCCVFSLCIHFFLRENRVKSTLILILTSDSNRFDISSSLCHSANITPQQSPLVPICWIYHHSTDRYFHCTSSSSLPPRLLHNSSLRTTSLQTSSLPGNHLLTFTAPTRGFLSFEASPSSTFRSFPAPGGAVPRPLRSCRSSSPLALTDTRRAPLDLFRPWCPRAAKNGGGGGVSLWGVAGIAALTRLFYTVVAVLSNVVGLWERTYCVAWQWCWRAAAIIMLKVLYECLCLCLSSFCLGSMAVVVGREEGCANVL